ncbi:MAG: NAD(P)H nitroreductase [Tissierella sp.]|nr:NAD(P)H nitroreductase [Tissierella sp.]
MLDLLLNRRSIRKFKDQKVEKDKLDMILKGALTSPSGKNIQPWDLVIVDDKEILEKLAASRGGPSKPLANAPLAIVVVANPELTNVWVEDTSIISTIIQLMAESLGLGSCWIQSRQRFTQADENMVVSDYVRDILGIPENYFVESMIAIGYPDEEKKPHEIDLDIDKIHYNKF